MSDFVYDDKKIAKIWLRSNIVVERHKDGTFKITVYLGEDVDDYAEDFAGDEIAWSESENHTTTAEAMTNMAMACLREKYGDTTFVFADDYLPDDWEEPMTETDKQAKELAGMAAELRTMLAE